MKLTTLRADLLLLTAAVIWGSGFVAQRLGSEHLGAFAFTGLRFTLGTLLLLPLLAFAPWPTHVDRATSRRATLRGGVFAGLVMLAAANAQQFGLGGTTASNGAFITSLYVVFVPFLGLFAKQRIGWPVWTGVALAGVGLLLLGMTDDYRMTPGDLWVLLCAVLWAVHVVVVGRYTKDAEPIRLSLIQLGITGVGALSIALARGTVPIEGVVAAKWAILYGAALPVAVALRCRSSRNARRHPRTRRSSSRSRACSACCAASCSSPSGRRCSSMPAPRSCSRASSCRRRFVRRK